MRDLLLTLGHNASAVLIEDGHVLNAYEAERLTGVKSDSRFPIAAIEALVERSGCRAGGTAFDRVYVCHWDPANEVEGMKSKYWDRSVFRKDMPIIAQENLGLTHHDAHAHSALAFAGDDFPKHDAGILVIDGFGNIAEHMSYYRLNDGGVPMLIKRMYGYSTSLGLMYQYATAFLGMKMHEDEYKLLGYGARVGGLDLDMSNIETIAMKRSRQLLNSLRGFPDHRYTVNLDNLPRVQSMWNQIFTSMLSDAGFSGSFESEEARVLLGYMVQRVLENVVLNWLNTEVGMPQNLICTGGVFYNVALNRAILNQIRGKLCVMPLAGDQGNALGLWSFHNRGQDLDFGDLCWGVRRLEPLFGNPDALPDGLYCYEKDSPEVAQLIRDELSNTGFVNIVRDRMEFGPRALCNTTTLARADDPNVVDEINRINGRNSVMPFAPVIWHEHLYKAFPNAEKLHKSEKFMICAVDYNPTIGKMFPGAALVNAAGKITGRPQSYAPKYEGDSVGAVVKDHGILINTSFNVHGVPIVCDMEHIVHSHQYQRERNTKVITIVIKEQEQ